MIKWPEGDCWETNRSQDHPVLRKICRGGRGRKCLHPDWTGPGFALCLPTQPLVTCMSQSPIHPVTCQIKARTICLLLAAPQQLPKAND